MKRHYPRKEFIRLSTLGAAGLYLAACGVHDKNETAQKAIKDTTTVQPPAAKKELPLPKLYKKGDAEYDTLRQGFNKRIDKYPAAIALCTSTEDVQAAIGYARQNKLPVTIKSGGHCMEGLSCNDGGLVINLSELNSIEWLDANRIKIGPGCTLSKVYEELLPKKKILPSGSCGGVAIGGLSLGGGYGLFSRKFGLTCDSLEEVTLVDGNGEIHHSSENKELLWACRGGGNGNYGVVTEMIFRVHDAPKTITAHWFKIRTIDAERGASMLERWMELAATLPDSCFSAFILNGTLLNIMITNCEAHSDAVQTVIDALTPLVDKVTIGQPKPLQQAVKNYFGSKGPVYFKNASAGLYGSFDEIKSFIKDVMDKVNKTPGMIYQVNTMGGKIDDPLAAEASAFPHRARHFVSELQTYWESPAQGARLMLSFKEVQDIFQDNGVRAQYRNYVDIDFKNWEHDYYGDNYARLQLVKKQYDPDNIIRSEQSVKLPQQS